MSDEDHDGTVRRYYEQVVRETVRGSILSDEQEIRAAALNLAVQAVKPLFSEKDDVAPILVAAHRFERYIVSGAVPAEDATTTTSEVGE